MSLIRARYRAVNTIMNLPRGGGYVGLLDLYPNAAAAYSLRKLRAAYSGNVVRVRRSVDNAEADFNPTEITDGTLLSWVGGVNLLLFSEQFDNPYYLKLLGTLTTNQTAAPDGSLTADLFTKTSGINTVSGLRANGVYSSTGIHTYSIYVKQNVGDNVLIRLDLVGNTANATFNFSTKTISTVGANAISATATELSDGWFRLTLTGNVTSTAWSISIINLFTNPTNDSVYVWGAQLEEGATAGDYAPTTSNVSGYGYVTTWYDQSGNNDATQATAASQPKIVDAGVLVEENGKPAVDFNANKFLTESSVSLTQPFSYFGVRKYNNDGVNREVFVQQNTADYNKLIDISFINSNANFGAYINGDTETYNQTLRYILANGVSSQVQDNGGTLYTDDGGTNGVNGLRIGYSPITSFFQTNLKGQEIIIYDSDQSSNRTNIETNINDYYSIYP